MIPWFQNICWDCDEI